MLNHNGDIAALQLIVSSVVASVICIAVFLLARWAEVSPRWLQSKQWGVMLWSVIAALGTIIPSTWMQEQVPELPNLLEQEFDQMMSGWWGYLAIGLLAPLSEEIVFRGAVLRSLLAAQKKPITAIAISALLFSLVHLNPAQMPHAFLVGLLLGWMYWRTGSIVPAVAYHWTNNSVAYIIYHAYPDPNIHLNDIFKGSSLNVALAVVFSLLILLPALYQLHLWMRHADEKAN